MPDCQLRIDHKYNSDDKYKINYFLGITKTYTDVESYLKFLLFLIKLSFSDTTVIEGGRERKHS